MWYVWPKREMVRGEVGEANALNFYHLLKPNKTLILPLNYTNMNPFRCLESVNGILICLIPLSFSSLSSTILIYVFTKLIWQRPIVDFSPFLLDRGRYSHSYLFIKINQKMLHPHGDIYKPNNLFLFIKLTKEFHVGM